MKKVIAWEKWTSPFLAGFGNHDEDDEHDFDDMDLMESAPKKRHKVIISDMGIIPVYDKKALIGVLNFWIGHTDFPISHPICELIADTPGVESFEVMSPYRMRISIAKLFTVEKVTKEIGERVSSFFKLAEDHQEKTPILKKSKITKLVNECGTDVDWLQDIVRSEEPVATDGDS